MSNMGDLHMTTWIGAATLLSQAKDRWHGTLMMVGQPSEESGSGARRMLKDGLFTRFAKPTYAIALHDVLNALDPAGATPPACTLVLPALGGGGSLTGT